VTRHPVVVALTGASGAPYGVRLLEVLARHGVPVWLIASSHGMRLLRDECGIDTLEALRKATGGDWSSVTSFPDADRGALPASGSQRTHGMVICPCSMGTVAAIAAGTSRSLVERAADVTLKERRRLLISVREAPLSEIHLENMLKLARMGAIILPPMPAFYMNPRTLDEVIDYTVLRMLDQFGIDVPGAPRWSGEMNVGHHQAD